MGRSVTFNFPPRRIISLVPSQTELLFDLGLDEEVVGITRFCVHPREKWNTKPRIGGTKKFHFDKIKKLCPDLLIGNKEENEKGQIEALAESYPVWMSDIKNSTDALQMIRMIGDIVDKKEKAGQLIYEIKTAFDFLKNNFSKKEKKRVAYFIWKNPYMVAAAGTFIHSMIETAGFVNIFADKLRYPETTLAEVRSRHPDLLLLSSEPYPFSEKHFSAFENECPNIPIRIVNGEYFSWYGSRMLKAAEWMRKAANLPFWAGSGMENGEWRMEN